MEKLNVIKPMKWTTLANDYYDNGTVDKQNIDQKATAPINYLKLYRMTQVNCDPFVRLTPSAPYNYEF